MPSAKSLGIMFAVALVAIIAKPRLPFVKDL